MSKGISKVQMAALDGVLMLMKSNLTYRDLAADALGMEKWLVPDKDRLSHEQAITIIHHGNDLFKK